MELFEYFLNRISGGENAPLMVYKSGGGWEVWTTGQAAYCSMSELERVGEKWRSKGKGKVAN